MAYFIIFVALLSVIVIFYIEIHWRSLMKQTLVTEEVVVRRKRIKYVEVFWMIIFAVTALYSYEIITGEEISGLSSVVIVGIFFGWNRTIFEPYYTTDVIDGLDNYSLYLRSFDLDKKSVIRNRNAFTRGTLFLPEKLEKSLCGAVRDKVGMVYAIGDPGCVSPTTLEAASIYADDRSWQSAVAKLSKNAKLILLRIGDTDGCKWELLHCLDNNYIRKVIFVVDDLNDVRFIDAKTGIPFPSEVYDLDFAATSFGLFLTGSGDWKYIPLSTIGATGKLIDAFLKENPSIMKNRISFDTIRHTKSKSKWYDILSLLINPVAYVTYNRWAKPVIAAFFVYLFIVLFAVVSCLLSISCDEDEYYALLIFCGLPIIALLTIPWLWFAPKYSSAINSWGGAAAGAKANRTLSLWMLFYAILSMIVGILIY